MNATLNKYCFSLAEQVFFKVVVLFQHKKVRKTYYNSLYVCLYIACMYVSVICQ